MDLYVVFLKQEIIKLIYNVNELANVEYSNVDYVREQYIVV